jgi:hypothetical protein
MMRPPIFTVTGGTRIGPSVLLFTYLHKTSALPSVFYIQSI